MDFTLAPIPILMLRASPWPAKGFALSELASIPLLKNLMLKAKSYNDCDTETILYDSAVTRLIPGCLSNNSHES